MTNQEIRIAVARKCGLILTSIPPTFYDQHSRIIPNYPECLNACAQAVATLSDDDYYTHYRKHLGDITRVEGDTLIQHVRRFGQATPIQICEAFLRTV